jgi:hypothetical protein
MGLFSEAWAVLDDLPPEDKGLPPAHFVVIIFL